MNLISLNTWGGRAGVEKLLEFFKLHRDTDVFCLQEMWNGGEEVVGKNHGNVDCVNVEPQLLEKILRVLPEHRAFFRPHLFGYYGLAVFVKKDLKILEEGEYYVYEKPGFYNSEYIGDHARNLQYLKLATDKGERVVINFHGLWIKDGKQDTPNRIQQAKNIIEFVTKLNLPVVIAGDFNLLPENESLKMLERAGLKNLIKEYKITSTRTSWYTKEHKFADYTLVSDGIRVNDFKMLPEEVSDHKAMYLEFE